ncbi:MAG: hypothetical protein ACKPKO_02085, partial [Candidatus Fonsibacter sp.]
ADHALFVRKMTFSFLSLKWHGSALPLVSVGDYGVKLVQRLLYYTCSDLWLSEQDKDWHYPLLITLRQKEKNNWRNRSLLALQRRQEWQRERQGQ